MQGEEGCIRGDICGNNSCIYITRHDVPAPTRTGHLRADQPRSMSSRLGRTEPKLLVFFLLRLLLRHRLELDRRPPLLRKGSVVRHARIRLQSFGQRGDRIVTEESLRVQTQLERAPLLELVCRGMRVRENTRCAEE